MLGFFTFVQHYYFYNIYCLNIVFFAICTCILTYKNINKFVISTSRSFITNFGLAGSFLRFIESQNDFKEVITRFQKYVYFPRYIGVRTLQVRDTGNNNTLVLKVLFCNWNQTFTRGPYVPCCLLLVHNEWIIFQQVRWNSRRCFIWYLGLIFVLEVRYHHYIYVVGTVHLDIVTRLFNINSIEICNQTKVGKWFIWYIRELNSFPYLIINILYRKSIVKGKYKVINFY